MSTLSYVSPWTTEAQPSKSSLYVTHGSTSSKPASTVWSCCGGSILSNNNKNLIISVWFLVRTYPHHKSPIVSAYPLTEQGMND